MKTSRIIGVLLAVVLAVGISRWGQEQGLGWDFGLLGPHHKVTVTWTPSTGATSYNIYRTTVSGKDYVKVGTSPEPKFVDATVRSGAVLYYVVTAVSRDGKESSRSAEIKATVP
jgi:hypothetical protein